MPHKCARMHQVGYKVPQLGLFHHFSLNSVYRFLSNLHPSTICFWSFYYFALFCLPNLEDCEPAVWRHLISCVCLLMCWATKRLDSSQTIHCFYRDLLLNCTCMLDMYGFFSVLFSFSFLCLKMSLFFSDDSSMAFILHLWPPHFFGTATKKCQDFPPPPHLVNCVCVSAVLKCTTIGCH